MILVSVGHFVLFSRLLNKMDAYAAGTDERVLIQVPPLVSWKPRHAEFTEHIPDLPGYAKQHARVVVTHGAMTLIEMLEKKVPVICVPRRHQYEEHINDHQYSFARRMAGLYGFPCVEDVDDLDQILKDTPPTVEFDYTSRQQLTGFLNTTLSRWQSD